MRKSRIFTYIFAILILIGCLSFPVSADYSDVDAKTVDNITYTLSEDRSYYIVQGWEEQFSSLTIHSEIDGIPVKEIRETAFSTNRNLIKIHIPDSVEVIGYDAFRDCTNLTTVRLSKNLKMLPENCFEGCAILSDITLPNGLENIDDACFMGCKSLGDLKIPASVTRIGNDAFLHCESLVLDVSDNEYAAEYAARFNVSTDFKNTTTYFVLILIACSAVGIILFIIVYKLMLIHIKKHPTHNPAIYIGKFFGAIGKALNFIYELIRKLILLLLNLLLKGVEFLQKKLKERRIKKLEEKEKADAEKKSEAEKNEEKKIESDESSEEATSEHQDKEENE